MSVTPRRILHVFSTFDPGGPQLRQAHLFGKLPAHWSHEILAMDGRTGAQRHLPADRDCRLIEVPAERGLLAIRRRGRFLASRRSDLIVTYNWGAFDMLAAARLQGLRPLLHVVDGFRPDEAQGEIGRRRWARRMLYRRVDGVVVISEQLRDLARDSWRVPASRLHFIPNGIELERFAHGDRHEARARWKLPDDALVLGAVGGLRPVKDHATLIRAFTALEAGPGTLLALAGDGELRPDLETLARDLGVADRVHFLGHVDDTSLLYPALDLLVFSSKSEQMPITALEAMASSLPIVATAVGDLPRMLPEAEVDLLAPPDDVPALTARIRPFLGSPDLRERTGLTNLARCRETCSDEVMVASWEKLLTELLDRRGTP